MNWVGRRDQLLQALSPEVSPFVLQVLTELERENVFDAPGVISGILGQMRIADSDVIRANVARTESVLRSTFAQGSIQRVGA